MIKLPVVILAGGLASRLKPIIEHIPKSMIPINNTPFVMHQLELLKRNNVKRVHFCLGHLGEQVHKTIEDSTFPSAMKITYSFDGENLLGTGGAVLNAFPYLPDIFFVTYGDSFLEIDYESVESYFLKSKKYLSGLMTIYENTNKYDNSNVIFQEGEIILYSKKQINSNMRHIDFGLGILRKIHFNAFMNRNTFDLSEVYESLSEEGKLIGYESEKRFFEIGSVNGILDLSNYLKIKENG